jgi:hypothetical protein
MNTTNTLFEKTKISLARHDISVTLIGACVSSFISTFILLGLPGTLVSIPCYVLESLIIPGFKCPSGDSAWGLYVIISELWPFAVAIAYLLAYKVLAKCLTHENKKIAFYVTAIALTFVVCDFRLINVVSDIECQIISNAEHAYTERYATPVRYEDGRTIYVYKKDN